jgi:hypothetical protein
MKKGVYILFLFILVFSVFSVSAAENDTESKAYACLESKVNGKCSSLSTEEKIFSLLSIGKCKSELLSDSLSNQCWPVESCSVKTTAQAVLALAKSGTAVSSAQDWLLSQSATFKDMSWFLQVEAANKTTCTASYLGSNYQFTINEDKTISGRAGTCLSIYQNYWFKIASSCYDEELKISCSDSFFTSLLYQKRNSRTVYDFYVPERTSSAAGEGTTTEKVNALCFTKKGSCDYESTLWAAIVLKYLGKDVSAYLPYLVTAADSNSKYLPESFLYMLTSNFRTELLVKQQQNQWWSASGDKFYDTAVALLPFQNEDLQEKEDAKTWLGNVQGTDGCWQGNIRNTAFILYSLWTKNINVTTSPATPEKDCSDSGFFCMSDASCSSVNGSTLSDHTGCFGTNICCNKQKTLGTCSSEGGDLCSSGQQCLGGNDISSSDSTSSRLCCVGGTCGVQETNECETNGGNCRTSCSSSEKASADSCSATTICCVEKPKSSGLIWLLIVLILLALVAIGFIFRKKLRDLFLKIKFKKAPSKPSFGNQRLPINSSSRIYPGAVQRKIITPERPSVSKPFLKPSSARPVPQKPVAKKPVSKTDTNDLLKKLKDIGK